MSWFYTRADTLANRQYTSQEGGEMLKLLQTEAQLNAILWLDREKQRQLIVAA